MSDSELFNGRSPAGFHFRQRNPFLFGPQSPSKVKFKRGMLARGNNLQVLARLLAQGNSNKQICCETGICMETIAKMRRIIETERGKPILCSCGQKAGHIAWCPVREARAKPGAYKLNPEKVGRIRSLYRSGKSGMTQLARQFGVSGKTISRIVRPEGPRPIWRHLHA